VTGLQNHVPERDTDRRPWQILVGIIAVCFLIGIAFLVLAVWLDWS
jgi:hypothetical protein